MKLAAVQYRPPKGEPAVSRLELVKLAGRAVDQGAELVVLPELATTGYVWSSAREIAPFCEPANGPTLQALAPIAARGAWIVCGFAERADDGALYNSALVIGPDGDLACCYRKILLYKLDETWASGGQRRLWIEMEFGTFAPAICMDLNDPRLLAWLARAQPDILAFCTNWVEEGADVHAYWQARLRDFRGFMVAANRWGQDRGVIFSGRSAILAPSGRVLASAGPEGDDVLVVETGDWGGDGEG
ncbi:MAG: carbon-nitrogen hydrolase family protein [Oligoflexia bacterium]|nr:carbon-nitrogen hydrolase family protein [Oligoflexia bacterium]